MFHLKLIWSTNSFPSLCILWFPFGLFFLRILCETQDLDKIVRFLKKYKANPVTGKKMAAADLIKLKIHKNSKGEIHCPVLFKVFNDNTHIACIRNTGNVFSYDAIDELNIKNKNFKDLLTDEPFVRKDIIVLQDPKETSKFNMNNFHHIKNKLKLDNDGNYRN